MKLHGLSPVFLSASPQRWNRERNAPGTETGIYGPEGSHQGKAWGPWGHAEAKHFAAKSCEVENPGPFICNFDEAKEAHLPAVSRLGV